MLFSTRPRCRLVEPSNPRSLPTQSALWQPSFRRTFGGCRRSSALQPRENRKSSASHCGKPINSDGRSVAASLMVEDLQRVRVWCEHQKDGPRGGGELNLHFLFFTFFHFFLLFITFFLFYQFSFFHFPYFQFLIHCFFSFFQFFAFIIFCFFYFHFIKFSFISVFKFSFFM